MVQRWGILFFPFLFSLIIVSAAHACLHDVNHDGDVDGADLAYNIAHTATLDPAGLAAEFGRIDCQSTAPPVISNIAVTDVSGQSATISWTTDQPATSRLDFGETIAYGNIVADTELVSEHGVVLTGLLAGTTYHFTITAANAAGAAATSPDQTFFTLSTMLLTITSPADGETITTPYVLVQGTITGTTAEVGVTANGVTALTDSGRFAANRVPLATGVNTITAMAMDGGGNVALVTINVTCQPATDFIELIPEAESGIAPFSGNFSITATFDMATATTAVSAVGPVALDSVAVIDSEHFTTMVSVPGLYVVTAQVTDATGEAYTDAAAILIMDKNALDGLLKSKWNGMKTALAGGNIEEGLVYFLPQSKERYRDALQAISADLPQIFANLPDVEMIYAKERRVKYRVNRLHDVNGTPVTITYYVYFVKNLQGIWQIEQF
ncbi:MAG: fibronectin type III domain-containing protein [Desulfobulbaceae bacterium]|nr:fibronectin type III domain-containing protein [Desulfobulbaceae bacterium]